MRMQGEARAYRNMACPEADIDADIDSANCQAHELVANQIARFDNVYNKNVPSQGRIRIAPSPCAWLGEATMTTCATSL